MENPPIIDGKVLYKNKVIFQPAMLVLPFYLLTRVIFSTIRLVSQKVGGASYGLTMEGIYIPYYTLLFLIIIPNKIHINPINSQQNP